MVDGVVEGRPCRADFLRSQFGIGRRIFDVFVSRQRGGQVPVGPRVIGHQPEMVAEAQQEGAILRSQRGAQKGPQIPLVRLQEGALTAAHVDHQPERERNIDAAREEGDLLGHAVFEDFEVVLRQVGDQLPLIVAHREADIDQMHVGTKRRLAQAESGRKTDGHPRLHTPYYAAFAVEVAEKLWPKARV